MDTSSTHLFEEFGIENCKIELIENYPCQSIEELHRREGFYIQSIDCINRCIAGRTHKEWTEQNYERVRAIKSRYYQNNIEQCKERATQHRLDNLEHSKQVKREYQEKNRETLKQKHKEKYEKTKMNEAKKLYVMLVGTSSETMV